MTKSGLLIGLFLLQNCVLKAQETLYDYIKTGAFQIGYFDTLVFDSDYRYEAYGYKGEKPFFVQIWHPVSEQAKIKGKLTFGDFFNTSAHEDLTLVQDELKSRYREAVIRDCIEENLVSGEANDFGNYSHSDILDLISRIETKSSFHRNIESDKFPVIIYHHGSQSASFESFAMAEYFASRGFIFVSANYHLPYENTMFGLKPYSQIVKDEEEHSLKGIIRFAQSLSTTESIFFVGHSWGAQMAFRALGHDSIIKGLISLETTIEYKKDHEIIKEMWPEVFQKVITENVEYPFPVLLCAATGKKEPFDFFENLNSSRITFAPTKSAFEHNAYTSVFYLRYFIDTTVEQTDKEVLKDRLLLYAAHLELILEFIEGVSGHQTIAGKEIIFVE
jgi:pimeloyl-ACP methyl ester carboxylesterase